MARNVLSVDVPDPSIISRFDKFIEPLGLKKGYAVQGALELFMLLPANVREWLVTGQIAEAKAWLADQNQSTPPRKSQHRPTRK